jgi:hypothetical protein
LQRWRPSSGQTQGALRRAQLSCEKAVLHYRQLTRPAGAGAPAAGGASDCKRARAVLAAAPLHAALSAAQLDFLAGEARLRRFGAGEVLVREGEAPDALFLVASGVVGEYVGVAAAGYGAPVLADPVRFAHHRVGEHGAGALLCPLCALTGQPSDRLLALLAPGEVLKVSAAAYRPLFAADARAVSAVARAAAALLPEDALAGLEAPAADGSPVSGRAGLAWHVARFHAGLARSAAGVSWAASPRERAQAPRTAPKPGDRAPAEAARKVCCALTQGRRGQMPANAPGPRPRICRDPVRREASRAFVRRWLNRASGSATRLPRLLGGGRRLPRAARRMRRGWNCT